MAETIYFVHQQTKKRYKVVQENEDGTLVLENKDGVQWKQPFDKEHFKAMGYRPEVVSDEEDE